MTSSAPGLRTRPVFAVCLAAIVTALCAQPCAATQNPEHQDAGPVTIEGLVTDTAGAPVPQAEVTLVEVGASTMTTPDGRFRLMVASKGTYALRVRRVGFIARVIQVVASSPSVALKPIVLRAAPVVLEGLTVEGRVPRPAFALRVGTYINRMSHHDASYYVWDTHGAALSPNAFAVVNLASEGGSLILLTWFQSLSASWHQFSAGAIGCPNPNDVPLASAWVGWTDTVRMLYPNGRIWKRRANVGLVSPCLLSGSVEGIESPINAGATLDGWLVVGKLADKKYGISLHKADGRAVWTRPLPTIFDDSTILKDVHVSRSRDGAIVASPRWPFPWVRVDTAGIISSSTTPTTLMELQDSAKYSKWQALSVLEIGSGYVQSLISPRGVDRMILLYDAVARTFAATRQSGAPALLASDIERRTVIAIRFSAAGRGRGEIVEYEY